MTNASRRRALGALAGFVAAVMLTTAAAARTVTDSAGRTVDIPDTITRVFAAGPPASVMLYVLAPQDMIGWVRAPRDAQKPYLLPATRDLPELGRVTGRGDTLNLERLLAARPEIIIDYGTINDTYRSLADRVQTQTGIPYLLIDGRFENTPASLRLLADILGVKERGEMLAKAAEAILARVDKTIAEIPAAKRPRIYLARGPEGLESGSKGSINTEIIERVGGVNVVEGLREKGGIVRVSPEQVISWAPDTIITLDRAFKDGIAQKQEWKPVPAVADGRVFLAPGLPYGFIDAPPSLNRFAGLIWLLHTLYPDKTDGNLRDEIRSFYTTFYQVEPSDGELTALLGGSGG
ncbi:iron ABC transporter substrate-binding protein [[Pseudomonas] carboxydohydrogena]|uniref:Iron ABC transporter substrate-binding protein n=1 Tax=Afipia carboxydohydrogena TaxID=290 RepID=A0ABY8BQP5_AFICR|nr:iron ABC transporter substrate-binding protein [[Pseudomonas] carboxydohydrogena]WEF52313.1 iron ABC transporter substrate-binding protein [[Pseudomonas] carboxydohydrogena]